MTAKRFTVEQRQGATNYSIKDYYGELPLNEGMYYKSNADKLCKWLNTQHELLNALYNENEQLKAQLLYDGDGVCNICKHQYLVENGKYYVAKCEKEHEECSKVDLQYCEDFELVRDYE